MTAITKMGMKKTMSRIKPALKFSMLIGRYTMKYPTYVSNESTTMDNKIVTALQARMLITKM